MCGANLCLPLTGRFTSGGKLWDYRPGLFMLTESIGLWRFVCVIVSAGGWTGLGSCFGAEDEVFLYLLACGWMCLVCAAGSLFCCDEFLSFVRSKFSWRLSRARRPQFSWRLSHTRRTRRELHFSLRRKAQNTEGCCTPSGGRCWRVRRLLLCALQPLQQFDWSTRRKKLRSSASPCHHPPSRSQPMCLGFGLGT